MQITTLTQITKPVNNSVKSFLGERLYVTTGSLQGEQIDFESSEKVTFETKPSRANQEVEVGDILFAKMQNTQKTLLITEKEKDFIFSSGFFVLRPSKEVLSGYIKHFLNSPSFLEQKDRNCTGATQKAITLEGLQKVKIPLPPLLQQKHIIEKLDTLTELIALRKTSIQKTEELMKSVFVEMFGNPMINEKGWEVKELNKITKISSGGTPSREKLAEYYNGNIFWVKTTEVNGNYIYNTEEKITEKALKETSCKLFPKNTILLAMYGQGKTRGNVGYLNIEATTNQACAGIFPSNNLNQFFLYYFLKFSYDYIRSFSRGGNQENLNLNLVGSLQIPLPPLSLQNKFAGIVEQNEETLRLQKESLKKLEELYAGGIHESFRGNNI